MNALQDSLLELVRRTSAEIPEDVHKAILDSLEREKQGTIAASAMKIIDQNIALAKTKSQPICQDTGSIIFYVDCPVGFDQTRLRGGRARGRQAGHEERASCGRTRWTRSPARTTAPTSGPARPAIHFHQHASPEVSVRLVLKGGGCENVGAQYSLPNEKLKANRDLDGCRKAILDAVLQAQGKGCGPGILGVCIGGDRATGYEFSKQQFLRRLDDRNPNPELDKLEQRHRRNRQQARHRADGFRRQDHLAGHQDRRAQPPAGILFRQHQLHVLGVSPPGRDARRGRQGPEMALLNETECWSNGVWSAGHSASLRIASHFSITPSLHHSIPYDSSPHPFPKPPSAR